MVNTQLVKGKRTPQELLTDRGLTFEECLGKHQGLIGLVITNNRSLIEVTRADLDDIQQECGIALFEAFTNFDETRDIKFSTYAIPFINGRLLKYIRDRNNLVRKPRSVITVERFCRQYEITKLEELEPHFPRLIELGVSLNVIPKVLVSIQTHREYVSLNAKVRDQNSSKTEGVDVIGFTDDEFARVEFENQIESLNLKPRDLQVLKLRIEGYTQREIALHLGVSQVQVSRRLAKVREEYRKSMDFEE